MRTVMWVVWEQPPPFCTIRRMKISTRAARKRMNCITNVNTYSRSFDFLENEPEIYSIFLKKWLKNRKKSHIPILHDRVNLSVS